MNSYIKNYREELAKLGRVDDRPDDILTWEEGNWARQNAPEVFEQFPDFAEEWSQLREAAAPSLAEEGARALKRSTIGLGSTALGGAALLTGSDYLKRKAAALSMQASDPELAPTIPTLEDIDSPRSAIRYGISKFGEAAPSIGEAVALGLVGGAIGTALEPGAGTAVGAGAGVVEGLVGRGIIRRAIKSLVSKELGEEAIVAGLRKGVPEVVEAVTKNAKSIAGARAGTVTAGLNSFVLNAGDVYAENDDRGIAAGLGLIAAIPDTVLPALVVKNIFRGVSLKTGKEAAKELVGSNALKAMKAAGVAGFEGATESFQEAVNVVARNLKDGIDPLTMTDADKIRIREAGITGLAGGVLASPAVVMQREAQDIEQPTEVPPPAPTPQIQPPAPSIATPPVASQPTLLPSQRVLRMSPEQQVSRLAELNANPARTPDEEAEYQNLRALAPIATPEAAAAVAAGNLPLTPIATPAPTLPEPGAIATPQPTIALDEAVAPVPVATIEPVDIGDRSGRPQGAEEQAVVAAQRKALGLDEKNRPVGERAAPEQSAIERIFYRGTNPESTQRINEPFAAAKGKTFAARTPEGAAQYGSSIEEIRAKPEAKILSDDTPEFWRVIGRKRPPNGYIGSSGKAGESLVSVVNGAIRKAEAAGYDAISIGDADIGTVILNENAFIRTKGEPHNALQEPSPSGLLQPAQEGTGETGGQRGRVEQIFQGPEAAQAGQEPLAGTPAQGGETGAGVGPSATAEGDAAFAASLAAKWASEVEAIPPRQKKARRELAQYYLGKTSSLSADDRAAAKLFSAQFDYSGNRKSAGGQVPQGRSAQTDTPEFKKWFGDSKVVDEKGEPLVVYHGTSRPISAFRRKEGGRAIWFTDSSPTAETYAGAPEGIVGANVIPSYVTMKNPMVFDAEGATWDSLSHKGKRVSTDDLAEMAEEAGNDGLIVRNIQDDNDYIQGNPPSDHYAVFKPTQIKSAIGNRGTFDPANPDITRTPNQPTPSPDAIAPISLTFTPISDNELSAADRSAYTALEESFRRGGAGPTTQGFRLEPRRLARWTANPNGRSAASLADSIGKLFNRRVLFFATSEPVNAGGSVLKSQPRVIFVNTAATDPMAWITGHELFHTMERTHGNLAKPLAAFITQSFPIPEWFVAQMRANGYAESAYGSEWAAHVIGDRFLEREFWNTLAQKAADSGQGGMFRQIVDAMIEWLNNLSQKILNVFPRSDATEFNKRIDAVRNQLADTLVELSRLEGKSPAPRTSTEPTNPAVQAMRTKEFQAVIGRLVANGANVQILSQELLAQQTGEVLQQQLQALQQRLAAATTAPQRNELTKQIAIREQRMQEVVQMRGVTYNPYHIAVAMDDVMNASLDNLVTLLHEAAESLTMRLTPAQQGAVFRAVEAATAQMNAKMQAAARNTGATVADVPNPGELLAETMAQTLAAEGIPESTSLAQAIVRWVKEIYYRVAMAAQRMFGAEPNPALALDWYENQLRRELGGDYEYSLASLLDRFLPQPNRNFTAKFSGASGTPGGMVDFFDPVTQNLQQPWVQPTSDEALAWNMKFQTVGVNPGESLGIPAEESVARQTVASYSDQIEWLEKLHADIAPSMDINEFLGLVSVGEKTPHQLREALVQQYGEKYPGLDSARIGGERMTDPMNKWAAWQSLKFIKDVQAKHLARISKIGEQVKEADERLTEHATELNRLEPDVRNAELHEAELKEKFRTILNGLLKSYSGGLKAASKLGGLEEMIRNEENIGDRDPLPAFYAQAFANLLKADIRLFDYAEAIAMLDLPIEEMTADQIWKAIRENADTSEKLYELSRNKPLAMTIAVLARNSARQLDQIQLRRADAETFLDIRQELNGIRNATEAQLREMIRSMDDKSKARGLRQRLRAAYLKERRALQRASARIASLEEASDVLQKSKSAVAEKVAEMQQAIGGVFSEWVPFGGQEFTVMRRQDDGTYRRTTRKLDFSADGSAVDYEALMDDLAQNQQWLEANVARAGQKEYEQVKHQTSTLQLMDFGRAYQAHNYGKIMGFIDKFVRTLPSIARQAGHSSGNRIVQQFNKYEFIVRSGEKSAVVLSREWESLRNAVRKSVGIEDVGQFHSQVYNPVMFRAGVNPGIDQSQGIREAIALARSRLPKPPSANFNERMEAFLRKDKEMNDELRNISESNSVLVWDEKLGELRKALPRGWNTGMRMMNDGVVVTLIHDMEKAGWTLSFDQDAQKKQKKVVVRSTVFDALDPNRAGSPEERAQYYEQLDNTEALRSALNPYFTPGILQRWLIPFITKPGEPVFSHDGRDISQIDLQAAWLKSGGDVVNWIDNLGRMIDIAPDEEASPTATFRADMLRQLSDLFAWEAKLAYEASQTPDVFNNSGAKLHVLMDARVNDLMPEEHITFAQYDPTSVQQLLGQIAFHGAFGRNGEALRANLTELEGVYKAKKFAFDSLRSTTTEGKRREAKARGYDYDDLKTAVDHYNDVMELKGEIESAFGVKNIYGPLYDARAGMELLGFMVGQVVDQPKTALLDFLSIGMRPFAQHSFSPKTLKATGLAYADLAKNSFGGMLRDMGIDLVRMSEYAKETGEVEGAAFRRLPYGTILTSDTGKEGSFQSSLSQRWLVRPLRYLRAFQKKGFGFGVLAVPGAGIKQRFATEAAKANNTGTIFQLQQIINNGIKHFSTHPEDLANPAFRFNEKNLKLRGDRGMYDWFRNKTVEYNMGSIERIVRDAIGRQAAGERTITREMVEQLAQMNAQELDGASSINTAPAGLAQNRALGVMLPLLRWPLWMMHKAHEGLADANGRADFKSMLRGIGRLAAWNLPLGLAFTFLIDKYDEKILKKKNAMPQVSPWAAVPVVGVPLALATSPRDALDEAIGIGQRMIRAGNIYGLGADAAQLIIAPFDPGSGQRQFSLDQRVLVMSQFLNLTQAIGNWFAQGVPTWGSVWRPMVASVGGNGMLNTLDIVNNALGLDNAEARLTTRINAARWVNTAAKELGYETRTSRGYGLPTPMSVWTREMQLAAMANNRADFMEAYRKALEAAREKVAEDDSIPLRDREREALQRVLAGWRARNPFSGLVHTPTPEQKAAMLRIMNDQGRADVENAMRYYDAYTRLITPSDFDRMIERRMRSVDPARQIEAMRRRAAGNLMMP